MFIQNGLKAMLRKPLSTALLTLLLAVTSMLLCLSLGLSYAADAVCENLDGFYTTLAVIKPGPQRSDYGIFDEKLYSADDRAYTKMIRELKESPPFEHVLKIDRRYTLLGVTEQARSVTVGMTMGKYLFNEAFDYPNNLAILVIEKTRESYTVNNAITVQASYRVSEKVLAHENYSTDGPFALCALGSSFPVKESDIEVGKKYLVVALLSERSLEESKFSESADMLEIYASRSTYKEGDENATVYSNMDVTYTVTDKGLEESSSGSMPIMTCLDTDLETFWTTERGKEWLEKTVPYVQKHVHALQVVATEGVENIQYFNVGKAHLAEGSYISAAEYEQGSDVCMISTALADANGWNVGDRISLELYNPEASKETSHIYQGDSASYISYHLRYDATVRAKKTYTVVGLYQTENLVLGDDYYISPNTVFVPKASVGEEAPASEAPGPHILSIVIQNGDVAAFQAEAETLGYGDFFTYSDQGYGAIADMLLAVQASAGNIRNVCLGLWVFGLALVVFLFFWMQRKYAATMYQLGCRKGNIFVYVLTQLGVMTVLAAALSFVGSRGLYSKVLSLMLRGDIRLFDDTFSALSTGEVTADEVMSYLTRSPETFARIVGVQFAVIAAVLVLSSLVFALRRHGKKT